MNVPAFLLGAIGLAVLDAVLTSRSAASNLGGAEGGIVSLVGKFIDPATPAFSASTVSQARQEAQPSSSSSKAAKSTGPQGSGPGGTGPTGPVG